MAGVMVRAEVDRRLQETQARHEPRPPYAAILRDAGERVRNALKAYGAGTGADSGQPPNANPPVTQTPVVAVSPTVATAKRTMPQPPAARGVPASASAAQNVDPEQAIAASRKVALDEMLASRSRRLGTG